MTTKTILAVSIVGFMYIVVSVSASAQTAAAGLPSEEIARIEAQEFSRSLAQLKVQEVTLARARPLDEKALELNRAQQDALAHELTKLSVVPVKSELQRLESERTSLSVDLRPAHPKMLALQNRIEQAKATIAANR